MKKCVVWILFLTILTGCSNQPDGIEVGMELRSKLLQAPGCSFDSRITADYGDKIHTFTLTCNANSQGDISFTVEEPESISGITGRLTGEGGTLTFDDTALHFELLAEEQLSPISAPWIFLKTLRSGCITSSCLEEDRIRLSVDDSYEEDALNLDIWLNPEKKPEKVDILFDGRRILSISVENFVIL